MSQGTHEPRRTHQPQGTPGPDETHEPRDASGPQELPEPQKRLGEWLVEEGHITPEQLEHALVVQRSDPETQLGQICVDLGFLRRDDLDYLLTRYGKRRPIGELLVEAGYINHCQLHKALAMQRREGGRIGEILLREGLIDEVKLYSLLAPQYNLPFVPIRETRADPLLARIVAKSYAAQNRLVPISLLARRLTVALTEPSLRGAVEDLRRATGYEVMPFLTYPSDLALFFEALYGEPLSAVLRSRLGGGAPGREEDAPEVDETAEADDPAFEEPAEEAPADVSVDLEVLEEEQVDFAKSKYTVHVEDSPVVQTLVQTIISRSLTLGARDIHLEADVEGPRLRYRVDGLLRDQSLGAREDKQFRQNYRSVLSRLKILAHMDITEKRRPQDASFRMVVRRNGRTSTVDFRLSTISGRQGEGMVIRVLDELKAPQALDSLGLTPQMQEVFTTLIRRPMGIILITGPTGSGKSSTLYGALRTLYRPELKILTVEDPIEYTHPGIVQTEVNPAIENTFARFLRAFLRQDPDVIMVGEIRDGETAEMAIRAAQTGHLLLSTLHTTDSTSAPRRLLDLHNDPNGLATVLAGVMAQRLARRVCPDCREEYQPDEATLREWLPRPAPQYQWLHGRGCATCDGTGYAGRVAVAELWIPSAYEVTLIGRHATGDEIRAEALKRMPCMGEDAFFKAAAGLTTLEEARRVVPYEDIVFIREHGVRPGFQTVTRAQAAVATDGERHAQAA